MINARMLECENARMVAGCYCHNFLMWNAWIVALYTILCYSVVKRKQEANTLKKGGNNTRKKHSRILAFRHSRIKKNKI